MSDKEKPQMTQKEADEILAKFEIFTPKDGEPKTVMIGAHGDHQRVKGTEQATFDTVEGLDVQYLGPHGYDLDAGLQAPFVFGGGLQNYQAAQTGPENNQEQMYNYELSSFTNQHERETNSNEQYQSVADTNGVVTMKLKDGETSNTKELMAALKVKGYKKVVPVHCRGDRPINQTPVYYPDTNVNPEENAARKEKERQERNKRLDKEKQESKKPKTEKTNTETPDLSKLASQPKIKVKEKKKVKQKVKPKKAKNKGVKSKCFPW
ncbi:putative adhesin [Aquimarina spongiae]|uniref:Putative adhesin Stv domain-containing protein n=1 Tax=Aquimarina spongiae TaxID=570521 RepID=A0A1M6J315_9FLAO|nr:hypothetical protein [Aquimarina spongiae]SHJ41049.1 hypothetical protein SAMN04488508_108215 [Aquimarina spongiae]